ncbi:MAG: hypothetical protein IT196_19465 [Acidimicrobiales bacterium]|nr:hypothetical protein [Acidimicrobiales bacterium]
MSAAAIGDRIAGLGAPVRLALFAVVALVAFGLAAGLGAVTPEVHDDPAPTPTTAAGGHTGVDADGMEHSMEGS